VKISSEQQLKPILTNNFLQVLLMPTSDKIYRINGINLFLLRINIFIDFHVWSHCRVCRDIVSVLLRNL